MTDTANHNSNTPKKSFLLFLFVYLSVYLSSGFSLSVYTGTERLLFFLALALVMLVYAVVKRFPIKMPIVWLAALCLTLLSYLVNAVELKYYFIVIAYYAFILLFMNIFDFYKWADYYLDVMFLISAVSLILYALSLFFPSLIELLPTTQNVQGIPARTAFVAIAPIDSRNYGVFWEPGAFQTYLAIAILLELFVNNVKSKLRLIVFILAMITTFSTAGYATLLVIVLCSLSDGVLERKMPRRAKYALSVGLIGALIANYIIETYNPELYYTLFGKLGTVYEATSSAGVRATAVSGGLELFWQNPLTGVGITKLNEYFDYTYGHTMATCTFINWFAVFGIIYGTIMCVGVAKFTAFFSKKAVTRFLIFIVFFMAIFSENYILNPSILILNFYGFMTVVPRQGDKKVENT